MLSMPWEAGRELLTHHEDRQGKKGPSGMQSLPLPQLLCPRSPAARAAPTSCAAVMSPCPCLLLLHCLSTSTRLVGQSELLWHQLTTNLQQVEGSFASHLPGLIRRAAPLTQGLPCQVSWPHSITLTHRGTEHHTDVLSTKMSSAPPLQRVNQQASTICCPNGSQPLGKIWGALGAA